MKVANTFGLVTLGLMLTGNTWADDADQKERELLAGTWSVVSIEVNGQEPMSESVKNFEFVFTTAKVTRKNGDMIESETGYRLNLGKIPKWIDFTDLSGKERDKTFAAIYELNNDTMKFCFRIDVKRTNLRAEKFDGGDGLVLMILKRK